MRFISSTIASFLFASIVFAGEPDRASLPAVCVEPLGVLSKSFRVTPSVPTNARALLALIDPHRDPPIVYDSEKVEERWYESEVSLVGA
jgi:hypothetical protein